MALQAENEQNAAAPWARASRRTALLVPLLLFTGVVAFLAVGLTLNPREVPSPLIGKPVPEFALRAVKGRAVGLSGSDLRGEVSLVNVFASWCVACREEHPILLQLQREGFVPVHGLNYKDRPDDAARWLDALGDPYTRTGADLDGRVAIDWGVYGVPETFVIDRNGRIAYKHIGPITPQLLQEKLRPLIARLRADGGSTNGAPDPRSGGPE
jgi:cytochrome c biogenesis protein CcmG/thiol:disulfide interchange protein DsbE